MESALFDMAIKGAVVLAMTGAVAASMRSASAAMRHLVWSIGMVAVVALPVLAGLLPDWGVSVLPARSTPELSGAPPVHIGATGSPVGWVALWAVGTLLVLAVFVVGRMRVRWLARDATLLDHGPWPALATRLAGEVGVARPIRLLQSRHSVMPMMWGLFRPTILLPHEADGWSEAMKRDVILHELAHVKRNDYLSQMIARLGCAIHWFDPLAWLAARRLRLERERACDDRVIRAGSSPCDYASHLLAVARWRATGAVGIPALEMAGGSTLGDRLQAVLETGRRRTGISRRVAVAHGALAALLFVPLAVMHPEASPAPAAVAEDLGGILPLPPSVTARTAERTPTRRDAPAPAAPAIEANVPGDTPAPVAKIDRRSAPRTAISVAADDVRLLSRVVVVRDVHTETCSESKEHELHDEAPATGHRTTLVSVPRPIDTP